MFQANCSATTRTCVASAGAGKPSTRSAQSGIEKPISRIASTTATAPSSQVEVWLVTPVGSATGLRFARKRHST